MQGRRIQRILFAADFLAGSRLALDYAVAFAYHFKAAIVMVHALELSYPAREAEVETHLPCLTRQHAQERLEAIAQGGRNIGIDVETFVEEGIPSDVIPAAVERHRADLLVLGAYGMHRGIAHLLIGSNTERILLSASCPTMTVGAHVLSGVDPGLHFKEILYLSDVSRGATTARAYAAFLSEAFHAPLDICHLPAGPHEREAEVHGRSTEESPSAAGDVLAETSPGAAGYIAPRAETRDVLARAKSQHAGLIVLGVHAETALGRHLHTSFAYKLLSEATCPVISVCPERFSAGP
jgi:nucleotide-binding universal stress UspA family protein